MKKEIRQYINYYRGLWERQKGYDSVVSEDNMKKGFFVRHHSFARSDILEKSWFSEYTDEMFDSVLGCIACYRWYIIPEKLREVTGLWDETNLELLLDSAGYSTSFIAEELFCMIDICLEKGQCSENDLHRIRLAYNGLSGFQDTFVRRIVQWGNVPTLEKIHADANTSRRSGSVMSRTEYPFREDLYSGHNRRPTPHSSVTSIAGVFAV